MLCWIPSWQKVLKSGIGPFQMIVIVWLHVRQRYTSLCTRYNHNHLISRWRRYTIMFKKKNITYTAHNADGACCAIVITCNNCVHERCSGDRRRVYNRQRQSLVSGTPCSHSHLEAAQYNVLAAEQLRRSSFYGLRVGPGRKAPLRWASAALLLSGLSDHEPTSLTFRPPLPQVRVSEMNIVPHVILYCDADTVNFMIVAGNYF